MTHGKLTAYSGLTTKIRAMKSNLISPAQYDEIANLSTVSDLINYLQAFPSYEKVLANIDPANAHRGEVESKMNFSTYSDFSKIFHFAGNIQRRYLGFYFMKYEIAILKALMRNIMDSRSDTEPVLTDEHFKRHSKINIDRLSSVTTMTDFADNLAGTLYEKPIRKVLELDSPALFDFEMSLDLFFFTYAWNHKNQFVPPKEEKYFINYFGSKIDLLNTLWIYRCKNFYNLSDSQIYSFLIPVYHRLEKSDIKALVEAPDNEALFSLISNNHYGKVLNLDVTQSIESQFGHILNLLYMKDFKDAPYSLAAINAYFHLKNVEVSRVVTAMECIRYGYEPDVISHYINQKGGVL